MLLACLYLPSFYKFLSCTNSWSFLFTANLHMVDRFSLIYLPMVKFKYITNWGFPHCCFSNRFLACLSYTFCLIKYSSFNIIIALTTLSLSIQSMYVLTLSKEKAYETINHKKKFTDSSVVYYKKGSLITWWLHCLLI